MGLYPIREDSIGLRYFHLLCEGEMIWESTISERNEQKRQSQMTLPLRAPLLPVGRNRDNYRIPIAAQVQLQSKYRGQSFLL